MSAWGQICADSVREVKQTCYSSISMVFIHPRSRMKIYQYIVKSLSTSQPYCSLFCRQTDDALTQ